jgi:hypothetical protein
LPEPSGIVTYKFHNGRDTLPSRAAHTAIQCAGIPWRRRAEHYGSFTLGCQYETQGTPNGILGAVWNVLHAYWVVYRVVNFLLAIAGGTMLAGIGMYVSEH